LDLVTVATAYFLREGVFASVIMRVPPCRDSTPSSPIGQAADVLPVKALVLMEPFGAPFDRDALTAVRMSALLYCAEHSELGAEGNIFALAAALPRAPRQETAPGGHFIFFDPCPPAVMEEAPAACKDAAGVDRAAINRRIDAEVADFLRNNL
jgi:hypothetical protein